MQFGYYLCGLWEKRAWYILIQKPIYMQRMYIFKSKGKPELLNNSLQLKAKGTWIKVISLFFSFWYYIVLKVFA